MIDPNKFEPTVNFIPQDIFFSSPESPKSTTEKPQTNAQDVLTPTKTNIIPASNGSVMGGGAMQSPNFSKGNSGWQIDSDGTAEFQDITARGTVTADTLNVGGVTEITVTTSDNLQTALNTINAAGGGTLRLSPGTYTITADLTVYDNTKIVGDSSGNTIFDFNSGAYSLIWLGTDVYTTGTIASTSGTSVVGSGTTWTSAMVGRYLFIDNRWYLIVGFTDTTHITIATAYADGASFSGTYRISNVINNVAIEGLTIKNSTTTALEGTDILNVEMKDVLFLNNNKGFVFTNFMNVSPDKCGVIGSTSNGYELTNGSFFNAFSTFAAGNGGHGLVLNTIKSCAWILSSSNSNTTDGANLTSVTSCLFFLEASSNGGQGIELVSGCNNNFINNSLINGNTSDGIKLTATSDYNTIGPALNITNNGGYGINIAASTCDYNTILNTLFLSNTSGEYIDSGTNTVIVQRTPLPTTEFNTFWSDVSLFTAIDEGGPTINNTNGLILDAATANRSKGYRFTAGTGYQVFGGANKLEFSFLGLPEFNATAAAPTVFCVVGDLGAGASSDETKQHVGFKFVLGNNTITTYATNADGSTQTSTDLSVSDSNPHLYGLTYDATSIRFYVDGILKATHTTNLPTKTSTTAVNIWYFVFDADGNSNPTKGLFVKNASYKIKN